MKVIIKPALYGEKGLRYEAYVQHVKHSIFYWEGYKIKEEQVYWIDTSEGLKPTDYTGYVYAPHDSRHRSTSSVLEMLKVLKELYGNSCEPRGWRP